MKFSLKLFSCCAGALLSCMLAEAAASIDISQALQNEMIQLKASSSRTDTDLGLSVTITNLTTKPLDITSSPGILFEPMDPSYQNMLSVAPIFVHLPSTSMKTIAVKVYCTEVNDRFPSEDLNYQLASAVDKELLSLANYIYERPALRELESVIQSAVWAVSDKYGLSPIFSDDVEEVEGLRTFCSELTGVQDVWYDMDTDYSINEEGMIVTEPKEIKGELTLSSDVALSVRSSLVNEHGEELWASPTALHVPKGEVNLWFELRVENWPKGTYTVYYKSENATLLAQDFTL